MLFLVFCGVGLASAVVALAWLRGRRLNRLRSDACRPRATAMDGQDAEPVSRRDNGGAGRLDEEWALALSTPGVALWEMSKIDGDVIDGISQSSPVVDGIHQTSDTYGGFLTYVHDHGEDLLSSGSFNRLAGYVGEQRVAGLLEAQGEQIQMAVTANNPGWDLLVNGQAANVKTYTDASEALNFARDNPDLDYYLPEDAAHATPLENVTYLEGFNGQEVRHSLQESLESAQSLTDGSFVADAAFPGIPIVLVAMTAYRQRILIKEGKRFQDALKDGAIDVGARTLGAFAGLKAGAAAGAMVDGAAGGTSLGAGTVVGSVVGAVAGSKFGGWAINEYRMTPVRKAESDVFEAIQDFGLALSESGAIDILADAIYGPALRAEATADALASRVAADSRTLRWWLWPGADQVLREAALYYAQADIEGQMEQASDQAEAWSELFRTDSGAAALGLTFANVPELAGQIPGAEGHIADIARTKKKADKARRKYASH